MSSFTEANVEPVILPDGSVKRRPSGHIVYRLTSDFWFYLGNPADGRGFLVRKGTETDGPSIPYRLKRWLPRGLWNWLCRKLAKSSYVHDQAREDESLSKLEGDCIFFIAMHVDRVEPALRWLAFVAVYFNNSRIKWNASNGQLQLPL